MNFVGHNFSGPRDAVVERWRDLRENASDAVRSHFARIRAGGGWEPRSRHSVKAAAATRPLAVGMEMDLAWRQSRPGLWVVAVLTVFINLLKLAIPLFIFQVLDRVIASRSMDTLMMLAIIAAFAVVTAGSLEFIRRWLLASWGVWIESRFGKQLFVSGLNVRKGRGPSRALRDLAELRSFVTGSSAPAWLDVAFAPAFVLVVYLIHPLIALIVVGSIALILMLGIVNEMVTRQTRASAKRAKSDGRDWIGAVEHNLETVASLSMAGNVAERWRASADARLEGNLATRLCSLGTADAMRTVESLQRVACYGLGVWLVIAGGMTVGGVIAAAVLGRIGSSSVRKAMASWRQLSLTHAAYRRTARRISRRNQQTRPVRDEKLPFDLRIDNLTLRYGDQRRPVLRDLNLSLKEGQVLCVRGASGSGKSSLARLIAGALPPTSGTVRFGELEIGRFTEGDRQHLIGYQEQDIVLFQTSIAENITGLRPVDEEGLVEAARLAGINEMIAALPAGYETEIGATDCGMAAGERKRIGIARALYLRPKLIILDEPEASLDKRSTRRLIKSLARCRRWGATIVVTSQSDTFVPIADKVLVLGRSSKPRLFETARDYRDHRKQRAQVREDKAGEASDGVA